MSYTDAQGDSATAWKIRLNFDLHSFTALAIQKFWPSTIVATWLGNMAIQEQITFNCRFFEQTLLAYQENKIAMQISGSDTTTTSTQATGASSFKQKQQSMKDLNSALSSGDLAGAQKAYARLTANAKSIDPSSPLGHLSAALKNGELAGAQKTDQAF